MGYGNEVHMETHPYRATKFSVYDTNMIHDVWQWYNLKISIWMKNGFTHVHSFQTT